MGKFLIGFAAGVAVVFLALFLFFYIALHSRNLPPEIAANAALVVRLSGDVPEKPGVELPELLGGTAVTTIPGVWMDLKKAAADSHIRAVVLQPSGLTCGWAKLEELRTDVEAFKKSGKPVFAYLRAPSGRDYYLASAADRIYLGPEDPLMLKGLRAELLYFKGTLDKLGVTVEVEHAGKYKDFGDMFTRTSMSPETKEVTNSIVDGIYGNLVDRLAAARHKNREEMAALIDRGPFTATEARDCGLVDELRFEDQMWGELKDRLKSPMPERVSLEKYSRVPAESVGLGGKSRIALVVGEGDIVTGSPGDDGIQETSLTAYGFDKLLRQIEDDAKIKAVVVRIDSPGGAVTASDEIWYRMNQLAKKKPMVVSMSDVAASGGYYIALTKAPIVAYSTTETGSIGVVFGKPVLRGLLGKIGINVDAVERGRNADIDSLDTPLTPEQREKLRAGIDESYRAFVSKVAKARNRSYGEIDEVAQGRVWLGSQAREHGLVDVLGGLDTALDLVKKQAGIPASEPVSVTVYPQPRSLFDLLFRRPQQDAVTAQLAPVFGSVPFHAWLGGGLLRIMPNWVVVR